VNPGVTLPTYPPTYLPTSYLPCSIQARELYFLEEGKLLQWEAVDIAEAEQLDDMAEMVNATAISGAPTPRPSIHASQPLQFVSLPHDPSVSTSMDSWGEREGSPGGKEATKEPKDQGPTAPNGTSSGGSGVVKEKSITAAGELRASAAGTSPLPHHLAESLTTHPPTHS